MGCVEFYPKEIPAMHDDTFLRLIEVFMYMLLYGVCIVRNVSETTDWQFCICNRQAKDAVAVTVLTLDQYGQKYRAHVMRLSVDYGEMDMHQNCVSVACDMFKVSAAVRPRELTFSSCDMKGNFN